MSRAWDSQKVQKTSTPRPAASAAASRATRDLPMPGGPRHPRHHRGHRWAVAMASKCRHLPAPTDQARLGAPDQALPGTDRQQSARAHWFVHALDLHPLGSANTTMCSTSCAVDSDSITPPGGATDSIRCAIPTSPRSRVPQRPRPMSPAITRPEFRPTRTRRSHRRGFGPRPRTGRFLLDGQGGETGAKSVILQRDRGAEIAITPSPVYSTVPPWRSTTAAARSTNSS